MRNVRKSARAFLGTAEDAVPEAFVPTWNMDVFQEIEQMLIEKYGGGLHWGKSGGHLFDGLANNWTDGLLGIGGRRVEVLKKGCALEKPLKSGCIQKELVTFNA